MNTSTKRELKDGSVCWFLPDGRGHREDGPAVIQPNGTERWYFNGKLHRDNGPAITYFDGEMRWYHHGYLHRKDGPAIVFAHGGECWYLYDQVHRIDGPAITYPNGITEYCLRGVQYDPVMFLIKRYE